MNKRFTLTRLILAIVSTGLEEVAVWAVWRWLLPEFDINLNVGILLGVMIGWGAFCTGLFIFTTYALKKQKPVAASAMVGVTGKAAGNLAPEGMVKVHGELWGAIAEEGEIITGEDIVVTGEKGLKLLVRKAAANTKR
ncbi:MAG: NfeD family protein [Dehalococcoidales bacterium]